MTAKKRIRRSLEIESAGWGQIHPVLSRLYRGRGIRSPKEVEHKLSSLLSPALLNHINTAADRIIKAIENDEIIMVAGDYDCDGATGSAVGVRGLRMLGAKHVHFIVPNRFVHGYGLSPELVADMDPKPSLIITVDSGTSSNEGIRYAHERGIEVVVTDHHLAGDTLPPEAVAIVNPNVAGDPFPSKALAGVGVMFYMLVATRSRMREMGTLPVPEPDIPSLLDLVAIGTVADLVPLDENNRILVTAGLNRIRNGLGQVGLNQLILIAKKDPRLFTSTDIAFAVAPRLNAAGRLVDMSQGVKLLICDDPTEALDLATKLEDINNQRKEMQRDMIEEAERMVEKLQGDESTKDRVAVTVYDKSWHSGIVGLVASKLKESLYRPVFAFAPPEKGHKEMRGSGRSIDGLHLRDALAVVEARHPGLMVKFGGHAMAAGMSILGENIPAFGVAFNQAVSELVTEDILQAYLMTDGPLSPQELNLETARLLEKSCPWGQKFPSPVFENEFNIIEVAYMGSDEQHARLTLEDDYGAKHKAVVFFYSFKKGEVPPRASLAYELAINRYMGRENLQLLVRDMVEVEAKPSFKQQMSDTFLAALQPQRLS